MCYQSNQRLDPNRIFLGGHTTLLILLLQDLSLSSSEFSNFEALRGAEWPVSVFFEVRPLIYESLVPSSKWLRFVDIPLSISPSIPLDASSDSLLDSLSIITYC